MTVELGEAYIMGSICLPILILRWRRYRRFRVVTKQIPERLKEICRLDISLRAGIQLDQRAQDLG